MIYYMVVINIGLGVFNLIPLPPLDGSKVIVRFLPYKAKQWFYDKETVFYIIFLLIWITGLAGVIISPILNVIYNGIMKVALVMFGL